MNTKGFSFVCGVIEGGKDATDIFCAHGDVDVFIECAKPLNAVVLREDVEARLGCQAGPTPEDVRYESTQTLTPGQLTGRIPYNPVVGPFTAFPVDGPDNPEPEPVHLDYPGEALYLSKFGQPITFQAVVISARADTMYAVTHGHITCPRGLKETKACAFCPARETHSAPFVFEYGEELVDLCFQTDIAQQKAKYVVAGIPHTCKRCKAIDAEKLNISKCILGPATHVGDFTSYVKNTAPVEAYVMDLQLEDDTEYKFFGYSARGPKSKNMILITQAEPIVDETETFVLTQERGDELRSVFCPAEGQTVEEKIRHRARNMARNVTGLSGIDVTNVLSYHIAIDACYHSVLSYRSERGEYAEPGIVSFACVGDSRTGKSRAVTQFVKYYGLGDLIPCETATVAGLTAGLTQSNDNSWYVVKGAFAKNDRGLMILDELSLLSPEMLKVLGSARSEGRVTKTGVARASFYARARLILLSNPRYEMPMDGYNTSLKALTVLFGRQENLARNTFAMALRSRNTKLENIGGEKLYTDEPDDFSDAGDSLYPPDACRDVLLWVWSRTPEQVQIGADTWDEIRTQCAYLTDRYSDTYQLVKRTNIASKLASLACAFAGVVFSTDDAYTTLIVRPEHVQYAAHFLDSLYVDIGYYDASRAEQYEMETAYNAKVRIAAMLRYSPSIIRILAETPIITDVGLRGVVSASPSGEEFFVLRNAMLNAYFLKATKKSGYEKTPACTSIFQAWLREYALHGTIEGNRDTSSASSVAFSVLYKHIDDSLSGDRDVDLSRAADMVTDALEDADAPILATVHSETPPNIMEETLRRAAEKLRARRAAVSEPEPEPERMPPGVKALDSLLLNEVENDREATIDEG